MARRKETIAICTEEGVEMTYQYHIGLRDLPYFSFPRNPTQAYECWEEIKGMLAPEIIYEDGQLSEGRAWDKYKDIMEDAKCLHVSYPMPMNIRKSIEFWLDPIDEQDFI
jgi:hypothetical protein